MGDFLGSFRARFKPPPVIREEPRPDAAAIDGISTSSAEGCLRCVLSVPQGVSSSSVTMFRQQGTTTIEECNRLTDDAAKVRRSEMTLDEFKSNAMKLMYSMNLQNGRCAQLSFTEAALRPEASLDEMLNPNGYRRFAIREITGDGGFSSGTKLFLRPNIPFRISFNGEPITVSVMTLFHPCPIRVNNIQHDAVLTLGDIATSSTVILVPIVGVSIPKESGRFISKIASYITGTLQPLPGTGVFPRVEVPTGNDWNLSMLFPGSPQNGETVVDSGYFVWYSAPPVEKYLKRIQYMPWNQSDIYVYSWKPVGKVGRRIIMLKDPIEVSAFDFQTIKMLPATPSTEAFPAPLMQSLVYHTPTKCSKPAVLREGFDTGKCDPLAAVQSPSSNINPNEIVNWVIGIISFMAVFIGVYFAIKYLPTLSPYVKKAADQIGGFLARAGKGIKVAAAPVGQAIDTKLTDVKQGMERRRAEAKERSRSQERESELARQEAIRKFQKAEADAAAKRAADAAIEDRRLEARIRGRSKSPVPEPAPAPAPVRARSKSPGLPPHLRGDNQQPPVKKIPPSPDMVPRAQKPKPKPIEEKQDMSAEPGLSKPKPKRQQFEEKREMKPKPEPGAGTGLFDVFPPQEESAEPPPPPSPRPERKPGPEPGLSKPKPKRQQFEEKREMKPKPEPGAGTGLFDVFPPQEESAEPPPPPEPTQGQTEAQKAAIKKVEAAQKQLKGVLEKSKQDRINLLRTHFTRKQLQDKLVAKQEAVMKNAEKALKDAAKARKEIAEEHLGQLVSEKVAKADEALKQAKAMEAEFKKADEEFNRMKKRAPPHERGLSVKQPTAEVRQPVAAQPPKSPVAASLTGYRAPGALLQKKMKQYEKNAMTERQAREIPKTGQYKVTEEGTKGTIVRQLGQKPNGRGRKRKNMTNI